MGTPARFISEFTRTLSRTERFVLMLRYAEDLTPAEIGLLLDLSQPQVEQMIEDLRQRTREALEQHHQA